MWYWLLAPVAAFVFWRYAWPEIKDLWSYDRDKMRRDTAEFNRRYYANRKPRQ
jgi:hypothetical protein